MKGLPNDGQLILILSSRWTISSSQVLVEEAVEDIICAVLSVLRLFPIVGPHQQKNPPPPRDINGDKSPGRN